MAAVLGRRGAYAFGKQTPLVFTKIYEPLIPDFASRYYYLQNAPRILEIIVFEDLRISNIFDYYLLYAHINIK